MDAVVLLQMVVAINLVIMAGLSSIWYKIGKMEARLHPHIDNHHHQEVPPDDRPLYPP